MEEIQQKKNMKPLWKVMNIYTYTDMYTYTYTYTHIHIYICIYTCTCAFACARGRGRGGRGGEWCWVGRWVGCVSVVLVFVSVVLVFVSVVLVFVSVVLVFVSLCWCLCVVCADSSRLLKNEQVHQVKRMIGGLGNELFSIYSQTSNV